jgi:hypothetical protein
MKNTRLVLLVAALLGAPLAGGLIAYAAPPTTGEPTLDHFRDPYAPPAPVQKEHEPPPTPDAGVPDAGPTASRGAMSR